MASPLQVASYGSATHCSQIVTEMANIKQIEYKTLICTHGGVYKFINSKAFSGALATVCK